MDPYVPNCPETVSDAIVGDRYGVYHLCTGDMFFSGTIFEGPIWSVPPVHWRHGEGRDGC